MNKMLFFILLSISSSCLYAKNAVISLDALPPQKINADELITRTKLSIHDLPLLLRGSSGKKLGALLDYIATSKKPIVLKFYADWCKPCKRMKSRIESVAEHFNGQVTIISINIDAYGQISNAFGVRYIPTLVFIKNGKEIKRTNSIGKDEMINIISKLLS